MSGISCAMFLFSFNVLTTSSVVIECRQVVEKHTSPFHVPIHTYTFPDDTYTLPLSYEEAILWSLRNLLDEELLSDFLFLDVSGHVFL